MKNKQLIDLLYFVGIIVFGLSAFVLITSLQSLYQGLMIAGSIFSFGCLAFITRSLLELVEAQKKKIDIFMEIAQKMDKQD